MTLRGLVIGRDNAAREARAVLQRDFPACVTLHVDDAGEAMDHIASLSEADHLVFVLATIPSPDGDADGIMVPILDRLPLTRAILLTSHDEISGVAGLTDRGRLDLIVHSSTLDGPRFIQDMADQVRRYCDHAGIDSPLTTPSRETFMFSIPQTDDEIMDTIVAGIDDCLGYQPRVVIPPGVSLTKEGTRAEEAMLCLSGQVALERESHAGDILMHHASTGRIIGLLSLTDRRQAFFTSRTTTEVTGIRLTFEQLNHVLRTRPETELLIAVLLIRSLDRRLRRAEDIQIEMVELTDRLEREQEELQQTYKALEATRAELINQARFATLGELASGVAHELNNPISSIMRTTEHMKDDVAHLLTHMDQATMTASSTAMLSALHSQPLSTRESRKLKRLLTDRTGDPELASRLVLAGIREEDLARIPLNRPDVVEAVEKAAAIGTGLRNLDSASTRIDSLVDSLRSYARPDGDPLADIDIHETIEDTLRLMSHRLKDVHVEKIYGDIPHLTCHPGRLSQVWTNLLSNAAEAVQEAGSGVITIHTQVRPGGLVRVTVKDNGPGIDPELLTHIFEPRFTTKSGRVQYGMGLGLTISKTIIERHNGTISLDSDSTGTVATVDLPLEGP